MIIIIRFIIKRKQLKWHGHLHRTDDCLGRIFTSEHRTVGGEEGDRNNKGEIK